MNVNHIRGVNVFENSQVVSGTLYRIPDHIKCMLLSNSTIHLFLHILDIQGNE